MNFLKVALLILISWSSVSLAQNPPPNDPNYRAQNRLLVLRVVPGDKTVKLFFAGRKEAELDLKKDHKILSITAMGGQKQEVLQFKESGDAYEIQGLPGWKEPYELKIKSQVKGKVEEHQVKMPAAKP